MFKSKKDHSISNTPFVSAVLIHMQGDNLSSYKKAVIDSDTDIQMSF